MTLVNTIGDFYPDQELTRGTFGDEAESACRAGPNDPPMDLLKLAERSSGTDAKLTSEVRVLTCPLLDSG